MIANSLINCVCCLFKLEFTICQMQSWTTKFREKKKPSEAKFNEKIMRESRLRQQKGKTQQQTEQTCQINSAASQITVRNSVAG